MNSDAHSSFVLGTVQFGQPYGVANNLGQPDQARVTAIIQTAWENGIREFDTAQDYGISEKVLGIALSKLGISSEAKIISKIDPKLNHCDHQIMAKALNASLEKLKVPALFGLMLHKEDLLDQWANGLGSILQSFVKMGKVKKLGVSVYSPKRAIQALNMKEIGMIQLPSNILDRRFEKAGVFELAAKKNKQIYIRSVFLQGLILMETDDLPDQMLFARPVIDKISAFACKLNLTRHELALGYLKVKAPNAKLVVGVDMPEQVTENIKSWEKQPAENLISLVSESFDQEDEKILNPALWGNF